MVDYEKRIYTAVTDIKDRKKVEKVFDYIPSDVKSIIDVGCGNGLITNELGKEYNVLGVDINDSKLKFVETEKLKSSCDNIDRADGSFDLVFSSEMLEHLDDDLYSSTLDELNRLSRKYVLLTVPNEEPLHKLLVKCEDCGHIYNKNGHLRSFSQKTASDLHENWKLLKSETFGRKVRNYHGFLAKAKRSLSPAKSWIPKYWIKNQGVNYHFCTNCGHKNKLEYKFHPVSFALDAINLLITGKKHSHLILLFEKKNNI